MAYTDADPLAQLQSWYSQQCNGAWEHSFGVVIETLDNPGWSLKVDLAETNLAELPFDELRTDGSDEKDWYLCRVKDRTFEALCGPNRLRDVISIFLRWAELAEAKSATTIGH